MLVGVNKEYCDLNLKPYLDFIDWFVIVKESATRGEELDGRKLTVNLPYIQHTAMPRSVWFTNE